jgi:hypothetical protein
LRSGKQSAEGSPVGPDPTFLNWRRVAVTNIALPDHSTASNIRSEEVRG